MKRLLAIAALASATTYGIMAETGMASHESRYVSVRPGTYVQFVGLDWQCFFSKTDPVRVERGPTLHCGSASLASKGRYRFVVISLHHIGVSDRTGDHVAYRVGR